MLLLAPPVAQRCPEVGVTLEQDKANFTVLVRPYLHRPSRRRDDKLAVFYRSGSKISLGQP